VFDHGSGPWFVGTWFNLAKPGRETATRLSSSKSSDFGAGTASDSLLLWASVGVCENMAGGVGVVTVGVGRWEDEGGGVGDWVGVFGM
jgi:hypothetical protein